MTIIKSRRQNVFYFSRSMLMTFLGFVIIVFLISCGRRGDPVFVYPVEDSIVEQGVEDAAEKAAEQDLTEGSEDQAESKSQIVSRPDAPKGLIAAYTGVTVVLTWEEIREQRVAKYRIYRMEGETYKVVGESATPAFTDISIEADRVYNYRISAVGISEGPLSEQISVYTEIK